MAIDDMKPRAGIYRIQEFARLAGVTVRALHHYDRLGLLKPSGRSNRGYRLYQESDLARLEQIVVLKFLGLPLREIGGLLRRGSDLRAALVRQRQVLAEKMRRLGLTIDAIEAAERSLDRGEPDWNAFSRIVKEIEMQNNTDWTKKYYTADAQAKVESRRKLWSPELQADVSQQWSQLIADVEAAIADGESSAGPRALALARRWRTLVEGFTGGDPAIQEGLNRMWTDQANWPADERSRFAIKPDVQAFIVRAMNAAQTNS